MKPWNFAEEGMASYRRKPVSRKSHFWTPVFAGVTAFGAICLLASASLKASAPAIQQQAAPTPTMSNDMFLLEQESKFQKEKTEYLQQNVLDKILGPGKAVVIVEVEMSLESRNVEMGMGKKKSDKKNAEGENGEPQVIPQAKVLVPGVPMPKSPFQQEEDRGGQSQESGGQMQQKKIDVRTTIKKLLVTVLYDKKVTPDKLQAVKQAIIALLKVTENQMIFTPTLFTEPDWKRILTPEWLIPLGLILWLLLFLWGPLASFFRRLNAALEDKTQRIEQTTKMESETEEEMSEESEGEEDGQGGGGGGLGPDGEPLKTEEEKKEEEEAMKKFEPFKYVNESNLKGLAYLLRKEEPWIIALVLSYLKPEFAKEVFASFPPELQARVAVETATIRQTSLEQVMSIDDYVKKKIDYVLGGLENLLKILNEADKATRENILEYLRNEKPALYDRVREEVILFEDLVKFPDSAIQGIVREVGTEALSRSLRGASPEFMNKFFANMSAGAAALLKESMDYGRPLTADQIEEERRNLIDLIVKLERENKITIRKKHKTGILEGEEAADESEPLKLDIANSAAARTKAAFEPDPAKAQQVFQAGASYYEQGQLTEALQQFHEAVQLQPDFWQAYQYLGAVYAAQGMVDQAAGAYERMIELNPDPSLKAWVDQWKTQSGASRREAV
jgi:flagellar motor switch protein FliG